MGAVVVEMPVKYRKEMLADWIGAVLAKGNNLEIWWLENSNKITLGPETRKWLEENIGHFYKR